MQPDTVVRGIKVPDFPDDRLSIRGILLHHHNWGRYRLLHADTLRKVEVEEAEKLLLCHQEENGVVLLKCSNVDCGSRRRITLGCNSRLCTRCGKPHVDRWAKYLRRLIHPVPHRHLTFTVPEQLRPVLKRHRKAWKALMDAAIATLDEALEKVIHGVGTRAGAIVVIHPFGRDLGFKPHLHVICPEGAFERGRFVHKAYFPMDLFRKTWQYHVLTGLRKVLPTDDPEVAGGLIDRMFREFPKGFVVHVTKETRIRSVDHVIRYVGRYVRHPAIAESRLVGYDGERVSFKWKDHRTKEVRYRTLGVFEFIEALLQHVPERNFKVVRHYGVYARQLRKTFRPGAEHWSIEQGRTEDLLTWEGPPKWVRCLKCGAPMERVGYVPGPGRGKPAFGARMDDWGAMPASGSAA